MSTLALIILFSCVVLSKAIDEPNSCNKFEYVVQTLEKVIKVEFAVTEFEKKLHKLENTIDTIMNKINELDSTMVQSTKEPRKNIKGQQVAFTAHGATGKVVNTVLTFTSVDPGDGYDKTTGRFTCPVAGTYLFSATLVSVELVSLDTRSGWTYCWIRKNASNDALVISQEGKRDSASVSMLFHLSVGDLVDLGGCGFANYINTRSGFSSFIGSLIQAD